MKIRPGGGLGEERRRGPALFFSPPYFSEVLTRDIYITLTLSGDPPCNCWTLGVGAGSLCVGAGGRGQGGWALIRSSD